MQRKDCLTIEDSKIRKGVMNGKKRKKNPKRKHKHKMIKKLKRSIKNEQTL